MPKTTTHVLSTSRKNTTEFLVKSFVECYGITVLTTCYWSSSHCIPAQKFVPVSGELNHNRSPLVLDSDKGVFCHHPLHSLLELDRQSQPSREEGQNLEVAESTAYFFQTILYC